MVSRVRYTSGRVARSSSVSRSFRSCHPFQNSRSGRCMEWSPRTMGANVGTVNGDGPEGSYIHWSMATLPNAEASQQHWEVIERGEHLFQQLLTRDLPSPDGHLVIEMDIRPEFSNVRGALQGGLIAVLIDMCAGRLAYQTCDHENGFSTATSDLNVHFLSPVTAGPARTEARIIRKGK